MPKKKRPPIVNAVTLCVKHNWPDHKWVLDIEACPEYLIWVKEDRTYYSTSARNDYLVTVLATTFGALKVTEIKMNQE